MAEAERHEEGDKVDAPSSPASSTSSGRAFEDPISQASPVVNAGTSSQDNSRFPDAVDPEAAEEATSRTRDDLEHGTKAKAVDENATLAALAASSATDLTLRPGDEGDTTTPSFVLVASLRSQITDLSSQVTSLNSKLVSSYTRIGDLEDTIHESRGERSQLQSRLTALESDKKRWEREIEVGGWVERVRFICSGR